MAFDQNLYDQYYNQQKQIQQNLYNDYAGNLDSAAQSQWDTLLAGYNAQEGAARQGIQGQMDALPGQYQRIYDLNAVQELVGRRKTAEAMANAGLTDSGLNRTQQTALSLMRGNADMETGRQKQADTDALSQQLAQILADFAMQKATSQAGIFGDAANQKTNLYQQLMNQASGNASGLYSADMEQQAQRYAAEQQAKAAAAKAQGDQTAATWKNVHDMTLFYMKSGYDELLSSLMAKNYFGMASQDELAWIKALQNSGSLSAGNPATSSVPSSTPTPEQLLLNYRLLTGDNVTRTVPQWKLQEAWNRNH